MAETVSVKSAPTELQADSSLVLFVCQRFKVYSSRWHHQHQIQRYNFDRGLSSPTFKSQGAMIADSPLMNEAVPSLRKFNRQSKVSSSCEMLVLPKLLKVPPEHTHGKRNPSERRLFRPFSKKSHAPPQEKDASSNFGGVTVPRACMKVLQEDFQDASSFEAWKILKDRTIEQEASFQSTGRK